jgi:hypothetical protein
LGKKFDHNFGCPLEERSKESFHNRSCTEEYAQMGNLTARRIDLHHEDSYMTKGRVIRRLKIHDGSLEYVDKSNVQIKSSRKPQIHKSSLIACTLKEVSGKNLHSKRSSRDENNSTRRLKVRMYTPFDDSEFKQSTNKKSRLLSYDAKAGNSWYNQNKISEG